MERRGEGNKREKNRKSPQKTENGTWEENNEGAIKKNKEQTGKDANVTVEEGNQTH